MICLAVDWGGRRLKLGVVQDGRVAAQRVVPAESDQPLVARLAVVERDLISLCATVAVDPGACDGIGFAYPSVIDPNDGRILDHFGKFEDAGGVNLRDWARRAFGLKLAIDNDARAALIGEWQYGAGRGCDNLALLSLGTGLGTAAVIDGRLLRGRHGQAGILGGHFTVESAGRPCVCGNIGCAESEASSWRLEELARHRPDFDQSALRREPVIDYAAVFRQAAAGDACARALRDHSLRIWSTAAVNLVHAYDPERVILAGGIMGSREVVLGAVREWVGRHAHTPWGKVEVLPSHHGDQAALLGCEWLIREQQKVGCAETEL